MSCSSLKYLTVIIWHPSTSDHVSSSSSVFCVHQIWPCTLAVCRNSLPTYPPFPPSFCRCFKYPQYSCFSQRCTYHFLTCCNETNCQCICLFKQAPSGIGLEQGWGTFGLRPTRHIYFCLWLYISINYHSNQTHIHSCLILSISMTFLSHQTDTHSSLWIYISTSLSHYIHLLSSFWLSISITSLSH